MKTRVLAAVEGTAEAVRLLKSGEVAALPTETVYGLGADALNPAACAKIFEAKERPLFDPLIVHVPDPSWLDILSNPPPAARRLAEAFWPGPLTLVVPRRKIVPDIVTAGQDTVALRQSAHPLFQKVIEALAGPIAAPSANRFGRISPTTPAHVLAELGGRIEAILDGGPCIHGVESSIVMVYPDGKLSILRHGPITKEQLSDFGTIVERPSPKITPGALESHYAPQTRLVIAPLEKAPDGARIGLLSWASAGESYAKVEHLSLSQDLREAAANLYGAMRRLDEAGLDLIVAEPVPEEGLGAAIMERLRKAAAHE